MSIDLAHSLDHTHILSLFNNYFSGSVNFDIFSIKFFKNPSYLKIFVIPVYYLGIATL